MQLTSNQQEQLKFFTKTFLAKVINDELSAPYLIDDLLLEKVEDKVIKQRKSLAFDHISYTLEKELCL